MLQKLSCMIVYPMGIQIYCQFSILRSWSKVKLHRAVLLGFGVKELKITLNIMKVGVNSYLPNKLCIFTRVGLKGVQIARNIAKVSVHIFISNEHPNLWSNFNSENLVKSETPSFDFAKEGKMALRNWKQMQPFRPWFHQVFLRSKIAQRKFVGMVISQKGA